MVLKVIHAEYKVEAKLLPCLRHHCGRHTMVAGLLGRSAEDHFFCWDSVPFQARAQETGIKHLSPVPAAAARWVGFTLLVPSVHHRHSLR